MALYEARARTDRGDPIFPRVRTGGVWARWLLALGAIGALAACDDAASAADAGLDELDAIDDTPDAAAGTDAAPGDAALAADATADARRWVGAGPFAGAWLCQYAATTTFTAPIAQTIMSTGVDHVAITDGSAADLLLAVDGPTGACTFAADRDGNLAVLRPGQTCVRVTSGVTITFTLAAGRGEAVAGSLVLDLAGAVSGAMGSGQVSGSLTAQYQCLGQ